eukprot:m.171238 g.171238  ORF g.171238 m.171238 type:complete len:413 (-) comp24225_c0_seq2:1357-2595(-)
MFRVVMAARGAGTSLVTAARVGAQVAVRATHRSAYCVPLVATVSSDGRFGRIAAGMAAVVTTATAAVVGLELFPLKAECEAGAYPVYLAAPISPDLAQRRTDPADWQARMEDMVLQKQAEIVAVLSELDGGAQFTIDRHERPNGQGGGITTVLQDSEVFEKAGVNVSVIRGDLKPALAEQMSSRGKDLGPGPHRFFASGISSVIHPRNPHVPTMHFNYRYFECIAANGKRTWWYGGGTDLTPNRLYEDDVEHFHQTLKDGCDLHDTSYYPKFKKWCDDYFLIKHRKERRGVGGIFFDDLDDKPQEELFKFVSDMASTVLPCYVPMVAAHKNKSFTEKDREWQLLRRGRYVEYNLVYDRGTKFGLVTPQARIESIFISMPLNARWEYKHKIEPGSPEDELTKVLVEPREWVAP